MNDIPHYIDPGVAEKAIADAIKEFAASFKLYAEVLAHKNRLERARILRENGAALQMDDLD